MTDQVRGPQGPPSDDSSQDSSRSGPATGPSPELTTPATTQEPATPPTPQEPATPSTSPEPATPSTSQEPAIPELATAGPAAPTAVKGRRRRLGPSPTLAYVFLLPAAILLGVWVVYPIIYSIVRSLSGPQPSDFVGLGNYMTIFSDASMLTTIRNNLIWVVIAPILVTTLGLIFAVLTERIRWSTAFKLIVFMPMAVSLMAAGVIFRLVYEQDPDKGVANAILTSVGDTFSSSQGYPDARPREGDAVRAEGGGVVATGQPALIPIVGIKAGTLPESAQPAKAGASGAVWFDFTPGGGGRNGEIDPNERGLPGMTVEAVQGGNVVATATTADDGSFAFEGVSGAYEVRLPQSNFTARYGGLSWLGPTFITPAIIGAFVWVWAGFAMVLIAAGLAAIPRDALEAARIDGATEWQVFRKITVPLLSPVLLVVFVTMIINTLKVFDLVFIIAPASVQDEAMVLALEMWRVSFGGGGNQGMGSAIAIFLLILVLPFMIMNIRRFRREDT